MTDTFWFITTVGKTFSSASRSVDHLTHLILAGPLPGSTKGKQELHSKTLKDFLVLENLIPSSRKYQELVKRDQIGKTKEKDAPPQDRLKQDEHTPHLSNKKRTSAMN